MLCCNCNCNDSVSISTLLVYRSTIDFSMLIFLSCYLAELLFILGFFIGSLRVSTQIMLSSANKKCFISALPIYVSSLLSLPYFIDQNLPHCAKYEWRKQNPSLFLILERKSPHNVFHNCYTFLPAQYKSSLFLTDLPVLPVFFPFQ